MSGTLVWQFVYKKGEFFFERNGGNLRSDDQASIPLMLFLAICAMLAMGKDTEKFRVLLQWHDLRGIPLYGQS